MNLNELRERAANIRLLLTDCDGVLTDGTVIYGPNGEESRVFSVVDGMGVELLRAADIEVGIISGERSACIRYRAEKLRLEEIHLGIQSKIECAAQIVKEKGLRFSEVAYIGDDINDLPLMRTIHPVGVTACPFQAIQQLHSVTHYRCRNTGGHGAFREFADWLLSLRGVHIDHYPILTTIVEGALEE